MSFNLQIANHKDSYSTVFDILYLKYLKICQRVTSWFDTLWKMNIQMGHKEISLR